MKTFLLVLISLGIIGVYFTGFHRGYLWGEDAEGKVCLAGIKQGFDELRSEGKIP